MGKCVSKYDKFVDISTKDEDYEKYMEKFVRKYSTMSRNLKGFEKFLAKGMEDHPKLPEFVKKNSYYDPLIWSNLVELINMVEELSNEYLLNSEKLEQLAYLCYNLIRLCNTSVIDQVVDTTIYESFSKLIDECAAQPDYNNVLLKLVFDFFSEINTKKGFELIVRHKLYQKAINLIEEGKYFTLLNDESAMLVLSSILNFIYHIAINGEIEELRKMLLTNLSWFENYRYAKLCKIPSKGFCTTGILILKIISSVKQYR